ncbi:hypothetical protein [Bradyrhizobium uaiense]|uniref:hypothetical protein n=1 Tax=Bradyrhizobium uaiense TaxID=2594946 RepID=UPI0013D2B9A5
MSRGLLVSRLPQQCFSLSTGRKFLSPFAQLLRFPDEAFFKGENLLNPASPLHGSPLSDADVRCPKTAKIPTERKVPMLFASQTDFRAGWNAIGIADFKPRSSPGLAR